MIAGACNQCGEHPAAELIGLSICLARYGGGASLKAVRDALAKLERFRERQDERAEVEA